MYKKQCIAMFELHVLYVQDVIFLCIYSNVVYGCIF